MSLLGALWLPIVLSAVLVFVVSAIIHMVLKYHNRDYTKLPNEDAVRAALRAGNPEPRQYIIPYCPDPKEMESPEMQQKFIEGPVGVLNLRRPGPPTMGPMLFQWFVFILVVSFFVAYLAAHTLAARRSLPRGLSCRRRRRVPRLCRRPGPGGDLDGEAVVGSVEGSVRRTGLRAGDGGDVRLALAAVRRSGGRAVGGGAVGRSGGQAVSVSP